MFYVFDITKDKQEVVDNVSEESEDEIKPDTQEEVGCIEEEPIKENKRPLLFSDFMEEEKDSFTYLENSDDSYHVGSIPLDDKKTIKQVVKSASYVFRYPRYILKEKVLGFLESKLDDLVHYDVYFPDYKLSFDVSGDYTKHYSESFKEYFEDLITRIRPRDMTISYYDDSMTITSLKVIETGVIEVVTDNGVKTLLLNNPNISFHKVLGYIRELSDMGEDSLTLKFLPEFFVEI